MSEPKHESTDVSSKTIGLLERLDSWAHVVVAVFFLLMATGVLTASAIVFVRQLPYLAAPYTPDKMPSPKSASVAVTTTSQKANRQGEDRPGEGQPNKTSEPAGSTTKPETGSAVEDKNKQGQSETRSSEQSKEQSQPTSGESKEEPKNVHPFIYASLELLSSLLFAVIILELLRTIITYLQSHDTRLIMKEFLIVGIISSVRKILMVGAESSLQNTEGMAFIQESIGVVLSVIAILLMIGGLIMLNRHYNPSSETTAHEE